MLSDYARYLENIRNGLIQCGVVFPQIDDFDKIEYGALFNIGEKLSDIMYFYRIMYCSGNMDEMFIPLDKSYMGTVRMETFAEFKEDILPFLKEQLGDDSDVDSFNFEDLCDIEGFGDVDEEPEVWVNEDVPLEDTIFDAEDLFADDEEESAEYVDLRFAASGGSLWGADGGDLTDNKSEYVSNGTDLFSVSPSAKLNSINVDYVKSQEVVVSYVSHGTELFSIVVNGFSQELQDEDVWVDDSEEVVQDVEVYEDVWDSESEDVWVSEEDEDENPEDVWVPEEDPEDVWDSEEDSEDIWVPEEDWSDNSDDLSEDGSANVEDWSNGAEEATLTKPTVSVTVSKPALKTVNDPNYERDIVDSVQDAASAALTSAKRFLARLTRPEE